MFYVYILKLANGDFYTGSSGDLKIRLKEHTSGQVRATKDLLPLKLVCYISVDTKTKALKFEKYLKNGSGFAFRNRHLI